MGACRAPDWHATHKPHAGACRVPRGRTEAAEAQRDPRVEAEHQVGRPVLVVGGARQLERAVVGAEHRLQRLGVECRRHLALGTSGGEIEAQAITAAALQLGFVKSLIDPCLLILTQEGAVVCVLMLYVDDLICAGRKDVTVTVMESLAERYPMGQMENRGNCRQSLTQAWIYCLREILKVG